MLGKKGFRSINLTTRETILRRLRCETPSFREAPEQRLEIVVAAQECLKWVLRRMQHDGGHILWLFSRRWATGRSRSEDRFFIMSLFMMMQHKSQLLQHHLIALLLQTSSGPAEELHNRRALSREAKRDQRRFQRRERP